MASTSIMSIMSWRSSASTGVSGCQPGGPYTAPSRVTVHRGRMSRMASSTLARCRRQMIDVWVLPMSHPARCAGWSGLISVGP
ncbi:hypothetical protein [Cutibacterium phage FD1]|nr:hypothetical protein [Cutibacterium phage FD1]QPB11585.1 hypothetical protein [Cutibacterium phage FD2]QPB11892.1 hypothetical protein [Cutibacterium phage PAVL45]